VLALVNIPDLTTQAASILATNIAAPIAPAAGKSKIYIDSTSKNLSSKNDVGTVNHGIQTRTATANNWIRSIADDGSTTISRPAFSDISGTLDIGGAQATGTLGLATLQTIFSNPTGTTSTSGVMMGLGGSPANSVITPTRSGIIVAFFSGGIQNSSTGGAQTAIRYGTGTAPANGAAPIGTQVGGVATRGAIGAGLTVPFACVAIITGLALATQVWLDCILVAATTGTASLSAVGFSAFELP
jgi:hypothetical protein